MSNKTSRLSESLKDSTSREKVLKKVRHALLEPSENPFAEHDVESSVYVKSTEDNDIRFAYELVNQGAKFIYCKSPDDMLEKVKALFIENKWTEAACNEELISGLLKHAGVRAYPYNAGPAFNKIAVTSCECLIARTGSIMISSSQESGRKLPVTCDIHIIIAFTSQVVDDLKQAFEFMRIKYGPRLPSMISIITGSSRSDDIEKIMVSGGHGPKELFVFMADEANADN